MEVTTMLNKDLNSEMDVTDGELENEQVNIECILKCVDILQRYTNDIVHVKRLMRILNAKEFDSYYVPNIDANCMCKHMKFSNLYNGITELEVAVLINKNYITNKEPSSGLKNEFKDIKYVANCISTLLMLTEMGICIKEIKELPDDQAYFCTNFYKTNNYLHKYMRFGLRNLWYYGYNGIEELEFRLTTDK